MTSYTCLLVIITSNNGESSSTGLEAVLHYWCKVCTARVYDSQRWLVQQCWQLKYRVLHTRHGPTHLIAVEIAIKVCIVRHDIKWHDVHMHKAMHLLYMHMNHQKPPFYAILGPDLQVLPHGTDKSAGPRLSRLSSLSLEWRLTSISVVVQTLQVGQPRNETAVL